MLALALGGPAAAGVAVPSIEETPPAAADLLSGVEATVADVGPAVLTDGRRLTVGVEAVNPLGMGNGIVSGLWAELRVTRSPLSTRGDIANFYANPEAFTTVRAARQPVGAEPQGDGPTGTLRVGDQVRTSVSVRSEDLDLPAGTWGVYGVAVVVHDGQSSTALEPMVVTWVDTEIPSLPLSVVSTASGTSTRVDSILDAADHPSVTLLVDPTMMTAEAAFDPALRSREIYQLPARHPDIMSLAHAEDSVLLEYATTLSRTGAPAALRDRPWMGVVAGLDAPTLQLLSDAGAVAVMVEPRYGSPSTGSSPTLDSPVANVQVPDSGEDFPLITPHPELSALVSEFRPSHPGTPGRVVAEAAMLAAEREGKPPVVVSTGSAWEISGEGTSPSLQALFNAPWVEPVTLADVLSVAPRDNVDVPSRLDLEDDVPAGDIDLLVERLERITRLSATTEDSTSLTTVALREILNAVSLHGRSDLEQRSSAVRRALDGTQETIDSVSITSGSALNLVAASGDVPVTIRNDLPVESTVVVAMMTVSPYIDVVEQPTVTIPPESEVTALVPVTAVSSANVNVSVVLRNLEGEDVTTAMPLEIRVRADWGNAVTGVFTVGLVLLLIAGLVRTIRRGRKDTRTGPGPQAAQADRAAASDHD